MGKELVNKLLPLLDKIEWPQEKKVTQFGSQTYEMGMDWVDQYDGDTSVLQTALKTFRASDSRPYAMAGVAYLLTQASDEGEGVYDQSGLDHAMKWLEIAQESHPDRPQINFIEGQIYLFKGELENARLILSYLLSQAPYVYRLNITQAMWCQVVKDYEGMETYYKLAEKAADNVPKKLRLQTLLGDANMKLENYEKALKHFKKAVYFNRKGDKIWHKMSLIYFRLKDYEECKRCNDIVMHLNPTDSAKRVQKEVRRKMSAESTTFLGRLTGTLRSQ